jgi:CheY-like chemotaxis protein
MFSPAAGVYGILHKPVTAQALRDALLSALGMGDDPSVRPSEEMQAADRLRGARILLVEDNPTNQELAVILLKRAGILAILAQNGVEALAMLDRHLVDGILMDIQMPVMDGYAATREIRRQPRFKDLPIIAMTANALAGDRERALVAGMNDHIAKPVNVHQMYSTMARWIVPRQAAVAVPTTNSATHIDELPATALRQGGIDVDGRIAALDGDVALYLQVLGLVREEMRHFVADFRQSRHNDVADTARRLAHTLKGNAGNIGAGELWKTARALELACRDHASQSEVEVRLAAVEDELRRVLDVLAATNLEHAVKAAVTDPQT